MKCLQIITDLSVGGAEKALFNLLNNGLSTMHDSYVISLMSDGALEMPIRKLGVTVKTLGMAQGRLSTRALNKLRKIVKNIQPDVIQGWMYHGNLAASLATYLSHNSPVLVWNIRQTLYNLNNEKHMTRWVIRSNRILSKYPESILYNSQLSRSQHETFGFFSKTGKVIPNGIDLKIFNPDQDTKNIVRDEVGIPRNALVVGHVARFHAMKDHKNFLKAAVALVKRHQHVYFIMLGKNIEKDNEELLPFITPELSNKLLMLGEYQNVARLLKTIDIFCMSSAWGEAFPNVIGEAMATGVPCVTTDVGESANIVDNTGIIVPPNDNVALYTGLEEMLIMQPDKRTALGTAASKRIRQNYSIESIVNQYTELYATLFNRNKSLCKNS